MQIMLFRKLFLLAVNARSFEDLCCGPIFGPVLGVFFLYFRWKLWPIGGLSSGGLLADTHTHPIRVSGDAATRYFAGRFR